MTTRREALGLLSAGALSVASSPLLAQAKPGESVLRIAMTVADIPLTSGQPSQGAEGIRFIGINLYDGLTRWDLSHSDKAPAIVPGLAESWSVSETDKKTWTFKLRQGVKFHDGSTFDADTVIWNLDKLLTPSAPQYDQAQSNQGSSFTGSLASWRKIDASTVEITTKSVNALLPYFIASIFMCSPARWEEMGRDWNKVASRPSGTGPWMLDQLVPRQRAELVRNPNHWNKDRIPKSDRLVLVPMPDANTRVAALLSGQVDWIEAPPPDAMTQLKQRKMQLVSNIYPHIWPYQISVLEDSPLRDVRVRKAANLAIDRDGLVNLLGGYAQAAKGMVDRKHPWFGKPSFDIRYDRKEAMRLLSEAGYGPDNPARIKVIISSSGSGQMQPASMNEYIKENFKEVGIEMEFEVLDWEALRARRRAGAFSPENKGRHGVNNSWTYWDPDIGLIGVASSKRRVPNGYNWGGYENPKADELADKALQTFDAAEQDKVLADLHTIMVDDAMWIWVVHDLNPRAMSPRVKGFVQAQSWFQDVTPVRVEPA
ncbi:ABC transporter substrate-binding protein [Bosea thiooxidans]|nr:ABC transporter substrate-binding protein [Bosea sp. (in: a-proteobacteria)]